MCSCIQYDQTNNGEKNQFTLSRECEKMRKTSEHTKLHQKTLWNTSNRVSIFLLTYSIIIIQTRKICLIWVFLTELGIEQNKKKKGSTQ